MGLFGRCSVKYFTRRLLGDLLADDDDNDDDNTQHPFTCRESNPDPMFVSQRRYRLSYGDGLQKA